MTDIVKPTNYYGKMKYKRLGQKCKTKSKSGSWSIVVCVKGGWIYNYSDIAQDLP